MSTYHLGGGSIQDYEAEKAHDEALKRCHSCKNCEWVDRWARYFRNGVKDLSETSKQWAEEQIRKENQRLSCMKGNL